ncbi:MAG TPA: biotin--[acetyl-CoA-carboxylase] ligase [Verrucomicrobiae bacterium]|nr:biotin--[acetyl-CoA-carboxylase] ligase [Verrucomicrobiae bacterium]
MSAASAGEDWKVSHLAETHSTNVVAASFGPWHAVRADVQTAGRGRFQRAWVSNAGGLWLSAVVPLDIQSEGGRLLPLAAGLAVCDVLRSFGVADLRLRWPNDVLVGRRKVAGLLIDCFRPGLAVVGMGVNVHNRPDFQDPALRGCVARLADLTPQSVTPDEVCERLLGALREVVLEIHAGRFSEILARVQPLWSLGGRVSLDLDGQTRAGRFGGVDARGQIILIDDVGCEVFPPERVRHLTEL